MILVGHGSRQPGFDGAMKSVAESLKKDRRFSHVLCAFLEINSPSISEAIAACVQKKCRQIRILPYFLLTGRHTQSDIPRIVNEEKKKYGARARIVLCPYLGFDPKIAAVAKKRILEAS